MTDKTDTELNEVIRVLDKTLEEYKSKYAESVEVKERIERDPKMFTWKWEDGGYWVLVYENYPKYIKELQTALTALRSQSEAERVKEASANRLTQRNSMGIAVLKQEFLCDRCEEGFWSLGEITDRLAYFEENKSEAERKIERAILELENNMYRYAECFDEGVYGKSAEAVLKDARDRCKEIIRILEGKADERE